jgi:hypothetical protein
MNSMENIKIIFKNSKHNRMQLKPYQDQNKNLIIQVSCHLLVLYQRKNLKLFTKKMNMKTFFRRINLMMTHIMIVSKRKNKVISNRLHKTLVVL